MNPTIIIFSVLILIFLTQHITLISENERVAVLRLGRFHGVVGPGIAFLIPHIDKKIWVHLPTHVPTWRGIAEEEIRKKVEDVVLNAKDFDQFKRVKG